ncbi:hydroxylamine reductase [Candidatus Bathyarchaeota archaeon RBG_13_38_9]|nr:MAG: hydroxylamine reductase [Candidatus Bathyarchaeota archaeon RBG_13_38_9]
MFCRQCEQTAKGTGCTFQGVCGKDDRTAALQDLLIYALKGVAVWGEKARQLGIKDEILNRFIPEALFTTITNVNFNPDLISSLIKEAYDHKERIKQKFLVEYRKKHGKDYNDAVPSAAEWTPKDSIDELIEQSRKIGFLDHTNLDDDIRSLREILLYGMKGMAAYDSHARILGYTNEEVSEFFYNGLTALQDDTLTADDLITLIMEFGKVNLKCLETLDKAHTGTFGNPIPTKVSLGKKKGPAIIVSGHDLLDLKMLLEQTKGKGINIYTHGEMLPAHAYPELKKYEHLVGHFGTAWQNQQKEFDNQAAILMTTNCIQNPHDSYKENIFTTGLVAWPGVTHISEDETGKKNFEKIIETCINLKGFEEEQGKEITVGFAHNTVLNIANQVIDAVKSGAVKHFFLIGGCDGAKPGRNYYTQLAEKVPNNAIILTLACGKFRFNTLDFGEIEGIPRLLDCGQCNDAYSAIVIATELAKAFNCNVNELPLSIILSWYEQKAVCILLTLLSLGIMNIKIGPSLPAFISPNILKVLVEKFNLAQISTAEEDVKNAMR